MANVFSLSTVRAYGTVSASAKRFPKMKQNRSILTKKDDKGGKLNKRELKQLPDHHSSTGVTLDPTTSLMRQACAAILSALNFLFAFHPDNA